MEGIRYERNGQWFTIDQIREQRKLEEEAKIKEKEAKEPSTKTKKEKVVEIEVGKGNEFDEIFKDEETTDPEPTEEEIKSKKKK